MEKNYYIKKRDLADIVVRLMDEANAKGLAASLTLYESGDYKNLWITLFGDDSEIVATERFTIVESMTSDEVCALTFERAKEVIDNTPSNK